VGSRCRDGPNLGARRGRVLNHRIRSSLQVVLVTGAMIGTAACIDHGPSSELGTCVDLSQDEHIIDLTWARADAELIVTAEVGPFASADAGREAFLRVVRPTNSATPVGVIDAHGSVIAPDGSIYLLRDDGIYVFNGASASLVASIPNAREDVVFWDWSTRGFVLMKRSTGNDVVLLSPGSPSVIQLAPPDADAFAVWTSRDGRVLVVTRQPQGEDVQFAVREGERIETFNTHESFPRFRWLTIDGQFVYDVPGRGLLRAGPREEAPRPALPSISGDITAVGRPSATGVVAYSGGGVPASSACFTSAIPDLVSR
jgi:hypothetical protein